MTFPLAIMEFHLGFFQTILWTNVGGIIGIYFFAYLSEKIIYLWHNYIRNLFKKEAKPSMNNKRIFSKKSRRIVRVKNKYGLIGIALITPILLSIPVGIFLIVRYFSHKKTRMAYMIGSNIIWSFIYALFYTFCYEIYINLFDKI